MNGRRTTETRRGRGGFTLIELLSAVAILIIIVTMLGVIFTESDRAWTLGTNRSDANLAARAALDMIAHDLQYAVADSLLTFICTNDQDGLATYDFPCNQLTFVSIENDSSDGNRAAREVYYFVRPMDADTNRFELVRGYYSGSIISSSANHCYFNRDWCAPWSPDCLPRPNKTISRHIAKNVAGFAVYAPNVDGDITQTYYSGDPTNNNRLPEYVDVCIEMMADRVARQAADLRLRGLDYADFVDRNAMRYSTRVYFHNRDGYRER